MKEYVMEVNDNGIVTSVDCELVRCGACKHGHLVGSGFCECKKDNKAHYHDWFCADGERKANGE